MASRLQQFATRDQKSGIKPKARKQTDQRKADPSRRTRQEPAVFDTDVESIGNATTLSFADFDENVQPDDSGSIREDADLTISGNAFQSGEGRSHGPDASSTPWRHQPAETAGAASRRITHDQWNRPLDHSIHHISYELVPTGHARLDDATSLPDSYHASSAFRDPSPSPQPEYLDETPRHKSKPDTESKQRYDEAQLSTPPPTRIQPIFEQHDTSQDRYAQTTEETLLDYSPTTLERMPYSELADEPFETDPRRDDHPNQGDHNQVDTKPTEPASILERIRAITSSESTDDDDVATHARLCTLFAQLPLQQYEVAGDAILEQFGAVFGTFQEIRRRKRATAEKFERQVAEREETVRARQEALDRSASWLKRQGEDVIRGGPPE